MYFEVCVENTTPRRFYNAVVKEAEKRGMCVPFSYSEWTSSTVDSVHINADSIYKCSPFYYYSHFADSNAGITDTENMEFTFDDEKTGCGYAYFSYIGE